MGLGKELVTAALTGRHGGATGLNAGERARLARGVYLNAKKPVFCNPFHLALGLRLELRAASWTLPAPIQRAPHCVYYEWHPDSAESKLGVYHGIAREVLASSRRNHDELSVCLFVAELAMPEALARTTLFCEAARLQPHVPSWWLNARFKGLHRSGVVPRLVS